MSIIYLNKIIYSHFLIYYFYNDIISKIIFYRTPQFTELFIGTSCRVGGNNRTEVTGVEHVYRCPT